MQDRRFDAITSELERLSVQIERINSRPFKNRIDLRTVEAESDAEQLQRMPGEPEDDGAR